MPCFGTLEAARLPAPELLHSSTFQRKNLNREDVSLTRWCPQVLRRLLEHPQAVRSLLEDALGEGPGAAAGALLHFGICKVRSEQESLPPTAVIVVYLCTSTCIVYASPTRIPCAGVGLHSADGSESPHPAAGADRRGVPR